MRKLQQSVDEDLDRKAKKMLSLVIERYASSHAVETTTSYRAAPERRDEGDALLEKRGATSAPWSTSPAPRLLWDDTPEAVTVSSFSPFGAKWRGVPLRCS